MKKDKRKEMDKVKKGEKKKDWGKKDKEKITVLK